MARAVTARGSIERGTPAGAEGRAHQEDEHGRIGLGGLLVWLTLFGVALDLLVGWPPAFPPLPSASPSWVTIQVWLGSAMLPTEWLVPAVGLIAWVVWGWTSLFVVLRVALVMLDALTRGAAWVRRLQNASNWLMLPAVRRAVDASLAGLLVARVVTLPATAMAQTAPPVVVVASAAWPVAGDGHAREIESARVFQASASNPPAADPTTLDSGDVIYTIRAGDTWSSIAREFCGDESHAEQVLNANIGRPQPHGRRITRQGLIYPGETVRIPGVTREVPATEGAQPVTVRPGETLWGIARRDLGDGSRWRDIYNLSKGAIAPDGHVLTNPNLIWPGLVVEEPAEQSAVDGEATRPQDSDSPPATDEPAAEQVPQEPTPAAVVEVPTPSPTTVQAVPLAEATPDAAAQEPDSAAPVAAPTGAAEEPLEPTLQPSAPEYPAQRLVSPAVGGAAGALAAAGLVAGVLVLRRRHPRAGRTQPESDVAVRAGFAEAEPEEDLAWRHTGDDLTPAGVIAARLSRAVAAELLRQGRATADELPLPGVSVAAVRHGRSSTTLILQQVPMGARATLIAGLPAAATQAFGDRSDVEGMVSRDGDVLVRLTTVGDQMRPSEVEDSSACEARAWPAPSMLLRLGLLADRQVLAANWDALSHVLVAAPLGQGADAVLGALLASLVAQRSPAQLGLIVLAGPRALPDDLLGLPHLLEAPVDPHDERDALEALAFVREELEERMGNLQAERPDLVLVLPELGELSTEHMAALGPIMLHGPSHRVRVIAASERRAVDLVQHCPLLSEFGTRLVLRTGDEEESIALLGSGDATELGPGGHLLVRLEGRVPLQAHGYRVAPDRLARLVALIREHSAAVEWWLPQRLRREPEASEAETTESVDVEEGSSPAPVELPRLVLNDEEAVVPEESGFTPDDETSTESGDPSTAGMSEMDHHAPGLSSDGLGVSRNGATFLADTDRAGIENGQVAERGCDRVGAEASAAAVLTAPRPRLRGRFFGAREFLYEDTLIWPTPGAPDEAPMELLVFLGVQDPSGVRAEVLGDSLWEEDDDEARADRLRKRRYRLRRALQQMAPTLEGNPLAPMDKQNPVYRLNPAVIESDVHRFLALLVAAKVLPREEAIAAYEQALELYRGDLLERPDVPPYRWLDEGPRVLDLRVKYSRMQQEARRRLADLLAAGPDDGLARAEELYVGLAGENPLDHQLWEALARLHGRRNDLLGLEATVRRLRNALVELGEADEPDRVRVPPALEQVFAKLRASLLAEKAPGP